MSTSAPAGVVQRLQRPGGRIAFTVRGEGPLVVAAPGMGDLRRSYDGLAAALVQVGFRVAVLDLRGHGDSDTSFEEVGDGPTAGDLIALVEHLGGPAVLLGNSSGGSAAVLAAADRPELVAGLVLLSPFLRNAATGNPVLQRILLRLLLVPPWGVLVWTTYYRRVLNRGRPPADLRTHVAAIRRALRQPGRLASFRRLAGVLDHAGVEPRLGAVRAPALVVVGALDPDYADPAAELRWMADRLGAESLLVEDAAHYPHRQQPDLVERTVTAFALGLPGADPWQG